MIAQDGRRQSFTLVTLLKSEVKEGLVLPVPRGDR